MKILEERCDVITNLEVMLLLVQQQQLLPPVDTLLRCASKPGSGSSSRSDARNCTDREDVPGVQSESAADNLKLDHVKELLYQHMFNQMVQDYIRKTCPYLHLARFPSDLRHLTDPTSKNLQGTKTLVKRSAGCRRGSGITSSRSGGVMSLISKRVRECLDALHHRYHLSELELLTIMNLGAFRPVEIYMFLDDCSSRFTEDDAAAMLNLIDLALMQQQALPPVPEGGKTVPMDVSSAATAASSEVQVLHQQQEEIHEEAQPIEQQQPEVQPEMETMEQQEPEEKQLSTAATRASPECLDPMVLLLPEEAKLSVQNAAISKDVPKEGKQRSRAVRTATAKRRPTSRRKRVLDD